MKNEAEVVQQALRGVVTTLAARGMPAIDLSGQLIRPILAHAAAGSTSQVSPEFWNGALAIQYAHEASLVHDDVIDQADTRRGAPTLVQSHGVAYALAAGDHLLTAAYRLAAETRSIEFFSLFTRSVERTVAGEIEQGKARGRRLSFAQYKAIAEAKSGELLAASLALSASLTHTSQIEERAALGRNLGLLYQMIDDLLDYCPATDTGKPALGDLAQKRWTWPLLELGEFTFDEPADEIHRRMCQSDGMSSALERCVVKIESEAEALTARLTDEFGGEDVGLSMISSWVARARAAASRESSRYPISPRQHAPSAQLMSAIGVSGDLVSFLGRNSKSFRFASAFLPSEERARIARVYSFCRITDDIADKLPPEKAELLLDEWMSLARDAYGGGRSGIAFLDVVMTEMRERDIPFKYAEDLADGMRMDLRGERYGTISELETYTYRVASVVGMWLTELAGVHDWRTLNHARVLGHAMQMTNVLRDVGEDARNGRIYLPASRLRSYAVTEEEIVEMAFGHRPVSAGYAAMIEEMLNLAEADYSFALPAVRYLPGPYRRTFAVAGYVYRGIHDAIRANGYDNLTRRAVTSAPRKVLYAARALWELEITPLPALRPA